MNTLNLISSTMALGAMIGITGTHYQQVQGMLSHKEAPVVAPAQVSPKSSPLVSDPSKKVSVKLVATEQPGPAITQHASSAVADQAASLDARESALVELLKEIRKEQKVMRAQLSETNRDMDELTFRVDSHSTQFRPLQAESGRPRALIVPDDEFGSAIGSGQLLPPKQP
ncbi:hypothetical protein HW115_04545 [Verrucomicrobiaceae bacterium N1E253]|uniref:Uncharacterized protein n=1 Tax=Oceaniferula marina TaxID=2748318 RepID=A0A851GI21_9BACT|nr:hypothetical protein [Oceaniferula marina]NWK54865.1 hypothetical protein [Oceaniferula marina]